MRNKRIYRFVFLLFLSMGWVSAQEIDLQWGELVPKKGTVLQVLATDPDEFYTLRWTGGRLLGHYAVAHHDQFKIDKTGSIKIYADGSMANFEGVELVGGKFVVFLSDKREGMNHFYMQRYGEDVKPEGEAVHLASYELEKGRSKGWFQVSRSSNKKYLAVIWEIPGRGSTRDKYGFKIYDDALNLINEGEYPLPFDPRDVEIYSHHIADNGDYFMSIAEYDPNERSGVFRNKLNYKSLHIYHISNEGLQDFTLDLSEKRVEALAMTSDDQRIFTITGTYGSNDSKGQSGVFYQRIDFNSGKVISEGFKPFEKGFVMEGWSERDKKRAEKREDSGKGQPQLNNFIMREAMILEDGSIVGTMEQFYIQSRTYTDSRSGQMTTTYYYYYNDIVVYRINASGEFDWLEKVRKYQVSTNDGGPYSSYEVFLSGDQLYFIFNDNSQNYDESGLFLDLEKIHMASYSKKKNVVALAAVNINSGEQVRKTLFERNEVNTLAVPKLFNVNKNSREILLYTILGRKEKFGKLKY